jgi:hypothetical protein
MAAQINRASPRPVQWRLPSNCAVDGCLGKPRCRCNGIALCNIHYQRRLRYGRDELLVKADSPRRSCRVSGCAKRARSRRSAVCEMHYYRKRRKNSFSDPVFAGSWLSTGGYMLTASADHPMASNGRLYVHRQVLFDSIGPGEHPCHWCRSTVEWRAKGKRRLVVDHVNGTKADNSRGNLVPSCHECNSSRGLFMSWVMKHRDDPFRLTLFNEARKAA